MVGRAVLFDSSWGGCHDPSPRQWLTRNASSRVEVHPSVDPEAIKECQHLRLKKNVFFDRMDCAYGTRVIRADRLLQFSLHFTSLARHGK